MANWYRRVIVPRLLNSVMGSEEHEEPRREVLQDASGVVLEIGVGPGYNIPIYRGISKLYALEPSRELIDIAKTRAGFVSFPVEFLNTGAENIPLPDGSVDTVVSTWTLCSVTDPKKVLGEIARVLKPRGHFTFADHGASPNKGIHIAQKAFTSVTKYFTGNCHCDRQIDKLIKETGFSIQKMKHPRERFKPMIYNYQGVAVQPTDSSMHRL